MVHPPAAPAGQPAGDGARTASSLKPKLLKLVRRVHLFAGLFLLPFVFAYGASGYLFNHPTQFRDGGPTGFGPEALGPAGFLAGADAKTLAAAVVDKLRSGSGAPGYELLDPDSARFSGNIEYRASHQDKDYAIRVDPDIHSGQLIAARQKPPAPPPAPFACKDGLDVAPTMVAQWQTGAGALAAKLGLAGADVYLDKSPRLLFDLGVDGVVWHASYDPVKGALSGKADDTAARELSWRSLLTSLHGARGYPEQGGVRWLWGMQVDAVAVLMMIWGLTGLVMWWQQKRLRRIGGVVLLASAVVAFLLFTGMHEQFVR